MKRFRPVLLLVLLFVSAVAADAQTVTLRYRWTKGEARTYRTTTQTDSVITGMPDGSGPLTMTQTMSQAVKLTAEEVATDGTVMLRQTFQSVRMETSGPMGKLVVDSASSDTNPQALSMRRLLEAMVGESVVIVMAPDGSVRSVAGASRIADKIAGVVAADPAAGAAGQSLKATLSDQALKSTFEQSFPKLPAGPVKAGETWTGQFLMGNPAIGRIAGTSTFTLKTAEAVEDAPLARIVVALALKQEVVPPPSGPAGRVMTLGDAKGVGEILFSISRGEIQLSTMRTDMPSSVTMEGPTGAPATMQHKTTVTMTMELVDK